MSSVRSLLRRTGVAAAVVALAGTGLVAAPSANAATGVITDNGDGTVSATWSGVVSGEMAGLYLCSAGLTLCGVGPGDATYGRSSASASGTWTIAAGDTMVTLVSMSTVPLPAGSYRAELHLIGSGNVHSMIDSKTSVQIAPAGGNGGDSASAPASVPVAMTLSLGADAGGAVCKKGSAEQGMSGSWMRLPGQGDCSLPSKPDARLLGWSTSASFPVAIAQRQADNKWGTYELTDADGNVTAIFIPAGWSTFVTAANSLYPIWAA